MSSQEEYASQVQTVNISKERRKQRTDSLSAQELHQYRGIIGAANWLTGSTRPDLAAWTALLQQRISRATVEDLIEANRLVAKIRDLKHTKITFKSIPLADACVVVTSDASWANCDDLSSQAAYMVLFAERKIKQDQWAEVSPLRWNPEHPLLKKINRDYFFQSNFSTAKISIEICFFQYIHWL